MTDKWLPKILKEAQIKGLVDVSRVWRRESTPAGPPSHSPDGRNGGLRSGEWRTTLPSVSGASPGVAVSNVTLLRFFRCRMRAFNGYHRDEEQEKKKRTDAHCNDKGTLQDLPEIFLDLLSGCVVFLRNSFAVYSKKSCPEIIVYGTQ